MPSRLLGAQELPAMPTRTQGSGIGADGTTETSTVALQPMTLSQDEMLEILEGIARDGGDTARIQAIKLLREMNDGEEIPEGAFSQLDELAPRRKAA